MNSERAIVGKWKMHVYGLIVIVVVQGLAFPLVSIFLREFVGQGVLRDAIRLAIIAVFAAVDLYFLFNRVILLRRLLNREPVRCKLEDIFLVGYKDDRKTRYEPFLIVRSLANNRLYLAYDKDSLTEFNTKVNYTGKKDVYCTIYKGDGTAVRLGDMVDMYMLKAVDVPVSVDREKNVVKLRGRKIPFRHMNERFDVSVFENVTFFKGAVDLDG